MSGKSEQDQGQTQLSFGTLVSAIDSVAGLNKEIETKRQAMAVDAIVAAKTAHPHLRWSARVIKGGHIELTAETRTHTE